jgi:hypothetical protein
VNVARPFANEPGASGKIVSAFDIASVLAIGADWAKPGELLTGEVNGEFYSRMWQMARADSFEPNEEAA